MQETQSQIKAKMQAQSHSDQETYTRVYECEDYEVIKENDRKEKYCLNR